MPAPPSAPISPPGQGARRGWPIAAALVLGGVLLALPVPSGLPAAGHRTGVVSDGTYALVAAGAGRRLRETAAARRRLDKLSGGVFVSLGLVAAFAGEPARTR